MRRKSSSYGIANDYRGEENESIFYEKSDQDLEAFLFEEVNTEEAEIYKKRSREKYKRRISKSLDASNVYEL